MSTASKRYEIVELGAVPGVPCPCGTARRAFSESNSPLTFHLTDISADAQLHYHKEHTETYYFLSCSSDAKMQLDDDIVPVKPGLCILIPPGVRHRGIGRMQVLIVSVPKFDPADEWFD
jgi:mannose-6-phosphate isomerase-like protein (cupin superfamily)